MTDEQILQLVKQYFTEEWCEENGWGWIEFSGKPESFVKFAQAIYVEGFTKCFKVGTVIGSVGTK